MNPENITQGDVHLAIKTWRKAAKLGSVVAQIEMGKIILNEESTDFYGFDSKTRSGTCRKNETNTQTHGSLYRRERERYEEMIKAIKSLMDSTLRDHADSLCIEELQDSTQAAVYLQKAVKNESAKTNDIAVAATLLGFMHLDGPLNSNTDAVQWFKLAAKNGSSTAEETLGWMYNTGQFGD